ncbi:adenylate kinase 7 [Nannospalax galili]|uniref:adenylate kinase 7 n=1 Tax=Nannospalax galili TaxID=1026970 RepID=UPI00111BF765|nr:adenylate kinase 7 [Nannospalax galili]
MAEEEVAAPKEKVLRIQRLFINLLDTYSSGNIGKFLANCVAGASLKEIAEEEEEEDEAKSAAPESSSGKVKEGTFQIVGTLSKPESIQPDFAVETYSMISREDLRTRLLECDVVIYNITEHTQQVEEAIWAVSALNEEVGHFEKQKVFILLSTVMTWAKSKPLDPDDTDIPFTEEDYRRRKHHLNFLDHINAEKIVLKFGKNAKKFATYVVATGLQYGVEGGILHAFFKMAWLGEMPALPVFGDGTNVIPAIHVLDLAGMVFWTLAGVGEDLQALEHRGGFFRALQPLDLHFPHSPSLPAMSRQVPGALLADPDPSTRWAAGLAVCAAGALSSMFYCALQCISKNTGPGKVQKVPKENAFLTKDLTQEQLDHLLVNLRMEALFVKENFNIRWVAQTGFVENINNILKEYKQSRGLLPIKICILGPPAVGKSSIAEELSKHYKLHHIKLKDVISESIAKLESTVAPQEIVEGDEEGEEEEEEENVEDAQELLDGIKESMEQNAGRLEDQYIIRFVKEKLKSMPCRNQGYILDGFPKTYDQAKDLFNQEDEEEEEIRGRMLPFDKLITPEFVCGLDASDEFLKERVMNLPESVVAGTHYSQDRFLPSLSNYRDINTDDETVFNYFDEIEVHLIHIDVGKLEDAQNRLAIKQLIKEIGEPRNYGLTEEEKEEEEKRAVEERLAKEAAEEAERERKEAVEMAEKIACWEEWSKRLEEVKREERELLEAQSIPLRNYLMTYVMPTLMQGLNECCKVRPDDPVDFLAEYLFKNNPEMQ